MLIDTMFARDMYQVYEINDDWLIALKLIECVAWELFKVTLVDGAHKNNTIACLGSNSSKTFIAVMVIKELAHKVRRCRGKEGVKTFFFVESGKLPCWY